MKKIPCIFLIDHEAHRTTDVPNPECQWVFDGEGIALRKWDGTACMIKDGELYKRRCVPSTKVAPPGFKPCSIDGRTNKMFGWVPVDYDDDKWHWLGFDNLCSRIYETGKAPADGTYELCGPKINGNPEKLTEHDLIQHSYAQLMACPRPPFYGPMTHESLGLWLADKDIEGLVFWHPAGHKAKIRKKDFGLER